MFKALQITQPESGYRCDLTELDESSLPEGDVTVQVAWSTINYKDGLAITGRSPVVRKFPMVPGIDFAGTVTDSQHPRFKPGDRVVLNGWLVRAWRGTPADVAPEEHDGLDWGGLAPPHEAARGASHQSTPSAKHTRRIAGGSAGSGTLSTSGSPAA